MKNKIGISILIIGILHMCLGSIKYASHFKEMIIKGIFNTANTNEQKLAFWFTFCGIIFILLGYLVMQLEKNNLQIPSTFSWSLLTCSITGIIILPISGFWILLIPSVFMILSNHQKKIL